LRDNGREERKGSPERGELERDKKPEEEMEARE
jgi:hypothetical protein